MFMLVKIELQNFSLWKSIWDKEKTVRESYGCLSEKIYRNSVSDKEIFILTEWEDIEDAQEFGMSDDLRKSLGKSGGLGRPEVSFKDEISYYNSFHWYHFSFSVILRNIFSNSSLEDNNPLVRRFACFNVSLSSVIPLLSVTNNKPAAISQGERE